MTKLGEPLAMKECNGGKTCLVKEHSIWQCDDCPNRKKKGEPGYSWQAEIKSLRHVQAPIFDTTRP